MAFVIFANSLDPDQTRQNVGPDLDTLMVLKKKPAFNELNMAQYQKANQNTLFRRNVIFEPPIECTFSQ